MPVTPRRGVARLYQSDLRPPAAGTASLFCAISILDLDEEAPPALVVLGELLRLIRGPVAGRNFGMPFPASSLDELIRSGLLCE